MQRSKVLSSSTLARRPFAHLENFQCRYAILEMPLRYDVPVDLVKSELPICEERSAAKNASSHNADSIVGSSGTMRKGRKCGWETLACDPLAWIGLQNDPLP